MGVVLDMGHGAVWSALQALSAFALVAAVVWAFRRGLFVRPARTASANMQVEERLALDLRSALLIVRVGDKRLLLATADAQPARLLCELAPSSRAESP